MVKQVAYVVELYNEFNIKEKEIVLYENIYDAIDNAKLNLILNSNIYIKNKDNLFIKYHIYAPNNYNTLIEALEFDTNTYYIYEDGIMKKIANVAWYGGRGGEYYILNEDEDFIIGSSNSYVININDNLNLIYSDGFYHIVGEIIFTDNATVHGIAKIKYHQYIYVYKKLHNIENYKIISYKKYRYLVNIMTNEILWRSDKDAPDIKVIKYSDLILRNIIKDNENSNIAYALFINNNTNDKYWLNIYNYSDGYDDKFIKEYINTVYNMKYNKVIVSDKHIIKFV